MIPHHPQKPIASALQSKTFYKVGRPISVSSLTQWGGRAAGSPPLCPTLGVSELTRLRLPRALAWRLNISQRPLPPSCIAFTSTEGKGLFANALKEGNMESYFPLASHVSHELPKWRTLRPRPLDIPLPALTPSSPLNALQMLTQNEPAYCALGTLATILNALEVDPQRVWKGPWRYYEQSMLDCCRPLDDVAQVGLTLAEFACLARCNGLSATVWSPAVGETAAQRAEGIANFRAAIKRTATSQGLSSSLMALAYSRKSLGQTGDGHFSPVGGFNEKEDMVLILDVARFKVRRRVRRCI